MWCSAPCAAPQLDNCSSRDEDAVARSPLSLPPSLGARAAPGARRAEASALAARRDCGGGPSFGGRGPRPGLTSRADPGNSSGQGPGGLGANRALQRQRRKLQPRCLIACVDASLALPPILLCELDEHCDTLVLVEGRRKDLLLFPPANGILDQGSHFQLR